MVRTKVSRIDMRATPEHKELLQKAAVMEGMDLSTFVLSSALSRANEIVEKSTVRELSRRDQQRLIEILLADEEPTPALLEAVKNYKECVSG